jgi:hypothetical protein
MKRLLTLLTPLVLVCSIQTARAQEVTNKGAVAIEDCVGYEGNLLGTKPSKKEVKIKAGTVLSFGRVLPLPDFTFTLKEDDLVRLYILGPTMLSKDPTERHIWVPEKSIKEFGVDKSFGTGGIGKATLPWIFKGAKNERKEWADWFLAAAKEANAQDKDSTEAAATQASTTASGAGAGATGGTGAQATGKAGLTGGPGVYLLATPPSGVTGYVWKDGVSYRQDKSSKLNSMFVSGDDVYVVGTSEGGSFERAMLWKNGVAQQLDTVASEANIVFVSGDDVYVAGTRGEKDAMRPVLWKNGEMQALSDKKGSEAWWPSHISISGGAVQVLGRQGGNPNPIVWKNGTERSITAEGYPPNYKKVSPHSLIASGGDVYAAIGSNDSNLLLWKNGKKQTTNFKATTGVRLFVSGKDLFIAGTFGNRAKLWKNGVEQKLEAFENPESLQEVKTEAKRIFVSGTDVYVLGVRGNYQAGGKLNWEGPILWKNGKIQDLPKYPPWTETPLPASDIFVVQ